MKRCGARPARPIARAAGARGLRLRIGRSLRDGRAIAGRRGRVRVRRMLDRCVRTAAVRLTRLGLVGLGLLFRRLRLGRSGHVLRAPAWAYPTVRLRRRRPAPAPRTLAALSLLSAGAAIVAAGASAVAGSAGATGGAAGAAATGAMSASAVGSTAGAGAAGAGTATATTIGGAISAGLVSATTAGASSPSFGARPRSAAAAGVVALSSARRPSLGSSPLASTTSASTTTASTAAAICATASVCAPSPSRPARSRRRPVQRVGHSWPAAWLGHPRALPNPLCAAARHRERARRAIQFGPSARRRCAGRRASVGARRARRLGRPGVEHRVERPGRLARRAREPADGSGRSGRDTIGIRRNSLQGITSKDAQRRDRGLQAPGQPCSGQIIVENQCTDRLGAGPAGAASRHALLAPGKKCRRGLACGRDHCADGRRLIGIAACSTASTRKAVRRTRGSSSPCPAASIPRSPPRCSRREGYDVVGVTLQLYDHGAATHRKGACCAGRDIHDARAVAERIGIPHYVLDYEARFKEAVIDRFAESYAAGETPVPCIECNRSIKFADLLGTARELGAQVLATGHYVVNRRLRRRQPRALPRARERARPELFPVRHHARAARRAALPARRPAQAAGARACAPVSASRSPTSRTARTSASCRPGATPTSSRGSSPMPPRRATSWICPARCSGRHDGIIHFTVGQRKGLKIAASEPLFVVRLEADTRRVVVGPRAALGDAHHPPARRELDRRRRARRGAPRGVRQGALDAPAARRRG